MFLDVILQKLASEDIPDYFLSIFQFILDKYLVTIDLYMFDQLINFVGKSINCFSPQFTQLVFAINPACNLIDFYCMTNP